MSTSNKTVNFRHLGDGTAAEVDLMAAEYRNLCSPENLTERVLGLLTSQKGAFGGCQVDLLEHGLQTATR